MKGAACLGGSLRVPYHATRPIADPDSPTWGGQYAFRLQRIEDPRGDITFAAEIAPGDRLKRIQCFAMLFNVAYFENSRALTQY